MSLNELLTTIWDMLIGRTMGPLQFRVILQPTMATILAIIAGLKDARAGQPPYLWAVFTDPAHRRYLIQGGWKDVRRVFFLVIVMDVVYELIVYQWVYPLQALLVAAVLAIVPYLIIRGPATRITAAIMRAGSS